MPKFKEKPELRFENFDTVRALDSETKMKMILEIFDLGKDKKQNKRRRDEFVELMGKYYEKTITSRSSITPDGNITSNEISNLNSSEESKKALHDKIIRILRNISLSVGPTKDQKLLAEYLIRNRDEVEMLIRFYFTGKDPTKATTQSGYLRIKEQLNFLDSKTGPEEE